MKPVNEDYKKKVYELLADAMIHGLDNGDLGSDDVHESASLIIEKLDNIATFDELTAFITDLQTKWPSYKQVFDIVKAESKNNQDQEELNAIQDKLKNLISLQAT